MNTELMSAIELISKEKGIDKDYLLDAIEKSLNTAAQAADTKPGEKKENNVSVTLNRETGDYKILAEKEVVEEVYFPATEISLEKAREIDSKVEVGDLIQVELQSKEFGRIAAQNAKNVILQAIREKERNAIYEEYKEKEGQIITGIVQRVNTRNISVNLGRIDAILTEREQVKGEVFQPTERIKVYVQSVENDNHGPRVIISRTHPNLVRKLFEQEVSEIQDGSVEIVNIAREPGSRTKMSVRSNDENVDAVGACVGHAGSRVNAVVTELRGEKIDIINWDENPANYIENALSPAKVVSVVADAESNKAEVVVPDFQLSLAIGKEGQNARLAVKLTGFKIDIKSEAQVEEMGGSFGTYEEEEFDSIEISEDFEDAEGAVPESEE